MTVSERDEFLRAPHVAMIAVDHVPEAPLIVPVWYAYEEGIFTIHTARGQVKTALLTASMRYSICVQSEEVPYRYVSASGPVIAVEAIPQLERIAMVERYLPPPKSGIYLNRTASQAKNDIAIRMRPTRWHSVDFGKTELGF